MLLSALPEVSDPLLAGWVEGLRRLIRYCGTTARLARLPQHQVGVWDARTNTLLIRAEAPLEDQVWLMQQCWSYLVVGPHATPLARPYLPSPRLQLVPTQRSERDAV